MTAHNAQWGAFQTSAEVCERLHALEWLKEACANVWQPELEDALTSGVVVDWLSGVAFREQALARYTLFRDIMATDAFQRLKAVRFLGSIDYMIRPNGQFSFRRQSRYDHSIDVAFLAMIYASAKGMSERRFNETIAAALLHDIGHFPLSHSMEPAFKAVFGVDHKVAGAHWIQGTAPRRSGIPEALKHHGIDPDRVIEILTAAEDEFLFSGAINLDTLDGISRTATYCSKNGIEKPPVVLLATALRADGLGQKSLDRFWQLKGSMYKDLIQSRSGLFVDALCRWYVETSGNDASRDDVYLDEPAFFKRHKLLHEKLKRLPSLTVRPVKPADGSTPATVLKYKQRAFSIDHSRQWSYSEKGNLRYKEDRSKAEMSVVVDGPGVPRNGDWGRGTFDDIDPVAATLF